MSSSHGTLLDPQLVRQPELGIGVWLNTNRPLTNADLAGRVTLVDFWDYSCVNCLRTLPYLRLWHERYAASGLTIIGVHAPEFSFSRRPEFIAAAIRDLGIPYPVLLDNDFNTWTRFANRAWPAKHIADHQGYIRFRRQGEGYYRETELALREMLLLRDPALTFPEPIGALYPDEVTGAVCYRGTPELFAGYESGGLFGSSLGNPQGFLADGEMRYVLPESGEREEGHIYVQGNWRASSENIELAEENGRVLVPYRAAGANAVIGADPMAPGIVEVRQDGRALGQDIAGADVFLDDDLRALLPVERPRLYALVRNPEFGYHELELIFHTPGLALYTLTFETCIASADAAMDEVFRRR